MIFAVLLIAADDLQQAEALFAKYKFAEAAALARKLLDSPTAANEATTERLLRISAFSEFYLGHQAKAGELLEALFTLRPDATIDQKRFPPQLVAYFEETKAKTAAKLVAETKQTAVLRDPKPPEQKPETKAPEQKPPAETIIATPVKEAPKQNEPEAKPARKWRPVSLLPFGIGQLAQGDYAAGAAWLVTTAACFAANIALHVVLIQGRGADGRFDDPARARALQIGQNVAAGTLVLVGIFGFIDSVAWTQGRLAKVSVSADINQNGGSVSLAGSF